MYCLQTTTELSYLKVQEVKSADVGVGGRCPGSLSSSQGAVGEAWCFICQVTVCLLSQWGRGKEGESRGHVSNQYVE